MLCETHWSPAMNEKWSNLCCEFMEGHSNVHNKEWSARPRVQTDEPAEHVKVRENYWFTISDFSAEFTEFSKITVFRTMTDTLGYHKLCP